LGLSWGTVSLLVYGVKALTKEAFDVSPETPEHR